MTLSPKIALTLAALGLAASHPAAAQTAITVSNAAPVPVGPDISQLSNAGGSYSPAGLNYYTDNNVNHGGGNPGQTFTTGSNSAGYDLSSVSVQVRDAGNGGGSGSPYTLYLDSISGGTATQISSTDFSSPGFSAGNWATFNLPSAQRLQSNTTYAFAIGDSYSGQYAEFQNSNTNPYSGGQLAEINPGGGTLNYGNSSIYDATFNLGLTDATTRQSFGLNFGAEQTNGSLAATDVAGVLPQANWNNLTGGSGSSTSLKDSSGTLITGTTVSYSAPYTFHAANNTSTPDRKLLNGYLDNNTGSADTVSVSGIKYSKYDVYAYFGSDSGNRTGSVSIGGTTYDYTTVGDPGGSYTQTTDSSGKNPYADYALFTGLTGSSFTLDQFRGNGNNGLFGLEVVNDPAAAPEPSQLAGLGFTAFGAMALILKARKRAATATPAA